MTDIELIGPMSRQQGNFDVAMDGYLVPYVTVEGGGQEWGITIDGRLGFDIVCNRQTLEQCLRILAAGMAVAAGRSSFGKNCRPVDLFNIKVSNIADMKDEP